MINFKSFFSILFMLFCQMVCTAASPIQADDPYEPGVVTWWKSAGQSDVNARLEYFRDLVLKIKESDYEEQYKVIPSAIKSNVVGRENLQLNKQVADAENIYPFRLRVLVFNNSSVFAGVFGLNYLVISGKTVEVMSEQELKSVVFHEYAHLLFLPETIEAARTKNFDKLKEIEIACDLTALYLSKVSIAAYESMLDKSGETDTKTHPSIELRKKAIRQAMEK